MDESKQHNQWQRAQRHELRWWKRYLSKKNSLQYKEWKIGYWKKLLDKLPAGILPPAGAAVLDGGCGPAGIFMALPQYRVVAIDPLLDEYVKEGLLKKEEFPWVQFVCAGLETLSLRVLEAIPNINAPIEGIPINDRDDGHRGFDAVFCMNVLNHVKDLRKSLQVLRELTSAGGHLVMTIDVHRTTLLRQVLRAIPIDMLHPHQHTLGEYVCLLKDSGFSMINSEPVWKKGPMAHWLVLAV